MPGKPPKDDRNYQRNYSTSRYSNSDPSIQKDVVHGHAPVHQLPYLRHPDTADRRVPQYGISQYGKASQVPHHSLQYPSEGLIDNSYIARDQPWPADAPSLPGPDNLHHGSVSSSLSSDVYPYNSPPGSFSSSLSSDVYSYNSSPGATSQYQGFRPATQHSPYVTRTSHPEVAEYFPGSSPTCLEEVRGSSLRHHCIETRHLICSSFTRTAFSRKQHQRTWSQCPAVLKNSHIRRDLEKEIIIWYCTVFNDQIEAPG